MQGETLNSVDRGWAWVVLVAAFIEVFLCSASYMSGIYNLVFLEVFQQSKSVTAWCASIHFSLLCFMGPVTSIFIQKIGTRLTIFTGATLILIGFVSCAFVTEFYMVFITYGFIAGTGLSLAYMPGIVILGFYFDKYRNLAFGIVTTAVGLGTMVFSPLVQYLIDEYGYRGSMMIIGGILSNIYVAGALMRPINFADKTEQCHVANDILTSVDHLHSLNFDGVKINHKRLNSTSINTPERFRHTSISGISETTEDLSPILENQCSSVLSNNDQLHQYSSERNITKLHMKSETNEYPVIKQQYKSHSIGLNSHKSDNQSTIDKLHQIHNTGNQSTIDKSHQFHNSEASIKLNDDFSNKNPELRKQMYKDSVLGRISSDFIAQSLMSINHINFSNEAESIHTKGEKYVTKYQKLMSEYSPLFSGKMIVFMINLLLVNFGLACFYINIPLYGTENGLSSSEAVQLLSIMGISNIMSRLITGLATNLNGLDIFVVYIGSCGLTGIILIIGPLISTSYTGLMIMSFLTGLYANCYVTLMSPIAIEFVGIQSLAAAFGLELLICGIGILLGPPCAGALYDFTGSYLYSLILGGLAYLIGALVMMLTPLF